MEAFCSVDPPGLCEDFGTPPLDSVAAFEKQLGPLLKARGLGRLVPSVNRYLRQYWAYFEKGQLLIEGNFVCPSIVVLGMEADHGAGDTSRVLEHPSAPVVVDDAGDCEVHVRFLADDPSSTVDPAR